MQKNPCFAPESEPVTVEDRRGGRRMAPAEPTAEMPWHARRAGFSRYQNRGGRESAN